MLSDELITRKELAKKALSSGYRITERTLRYWAKEGLIPKPVFIKGDKRAYYPVSLLSRLAIIEGLRRKSLKEIRRVLEKPRWEIEVGGELRRVVEKLGSWRKDGAKFTCYKLEDGTIILRRVPFLGLVRDKEKR